MTPINVDPETQQPTNFPVTVNVMGADSAYKEPPSLADYMQGPVPLDTYPAQWFNFLWNQIHVQHNLVTSTLNDFYTELSNILTTAGVTMDATIHNQLTTAIKNLIVAVQVDGSQTVKTSAAADGVTVNNDKTMSVNALSDISNLVGSTVVNAINANTAKLAGLSQSTVQGAIDAVEAQVNTSITVVGDTLYIDGTD